jgi:glucokinase
MYKIGVDLGGTQIKIALVGEGGGIVRKVGIQTRSALGYARVLRDIAEAIETLLPKKAQGGQLEGIGLATPGLLSEDATQIQFASNLGFVNVRAIDELKRYFHCRIVMTNDANAAALGEHLCGAGKGSKNSVTITLGTGIGSGVILDGRIVSGSFNSGAELGHHIIAAGGRKCPCGQRGCYEMYASVSALIADAQREAAAHPESRLTAQCGGDLNALDAQMIYAAYYQNDPAARRVHRRFIRYVGIGLINIVNVLQPDVIIIGGGVSAEKENLTRPLTEYVRTHLLFGEENFRTKICHALLGNDAGVVGAAMI